MPGPLFSAFFNPQGRMDSHACPAPLCCLQPPKEEPAPAKQAAPGPGDAIDLAQDKHRGQYALRKLYHESDRLLTVLYTGGAVGAVRSASHALLALGVDVVPCLLAGLLPRR